MLIKIRPTLPTHTPPALTNSREACELICTKTSPLFETTLADMIRTHYQELLDQMVEQRRPSELMEQVLMDAVGDR